MSTTKAEHSRNQTGWLVHDIVVGALTGAAAGLYIGLFAKARVADSLLLVGATLVTCAIASVALLRWERHRRSGIGPVTVLTWVVMGLSIAVLVLLIDAIRNFT